MTEEPPYSIKISTRAVDYLKGLDKGTAARIRDKINWLAANTEVVQHEALTGQWRGLYRLRVGSYRVIYSLHRDIRILAVESIGNRRDVYD